jgi:putative flippase GtrA
LLNRHAVFGSEKEDNATLFKYYTLAIGQMVCSAALVSSLVWLTGIDKVIVKIVADGFLFVLSFRIQRGWVFKKKEVLSSLSR